MTLPYVRCAHRWISLEPVYEHLYIRPGELLKIDWVVIGAQTKPNVKVPPDYIEAVMNACLESNIPVFLKKNLRYSIPHSEPFYHDGELRQELPSDLIFPEHKGGKHGQKS
jgi:protein gp37